MTLNRITYSILLTILPILSNAQINFVAKIVDRQNRPVNGITIAFQDGSHKAYSSEAGIARCTISKDRIGKDVGIYILPNEYILYSDAVIHIKEDYSVIAEKIVVIKKGTEKVVSQSINAQCLANINELTRVFIKNAPDRLNDERRLSEQIAEDVNQKRISLSVLLKLNSEAAYAGAAYYIQAHPDISNFQKLKDSYTQLSRNFTRFEYCKAFLAIIKKNPSGVIKMRGDFIALADKMNNIGDDDIKDYVNTIYAYLGNKPGWHDECSCYNFGGVIIPFTKVIDNYINSEPMRPFYISAPLTNAVLLKYVESGAIKKTMTSNLNPNKVIDSLFWDDYFNIADVMKDLSVPTFQNITYAEAAKAIELPVNSEVLYITDKPIQDLSPKAFMEKNQKTYDLSSRYHLPDHIQLYDTLKRAGWYYSGVKMEFTDKYFQPASGPKFGKDFYHGPFFLVRKIKHSN